MGRCKTEIVSDVAPQELAVATLCQRLLPLYLTPRRTEHIEDISFMALTPRVIGVLVELAGATRHANKWTDKLSPAS